MMVLEAGAFDVATALTTGTSLLEWTLNSISANPILTACFVCATLIPVGIGVFRHLKHAV